jgi:hypothetical protein
MTEEKTPWFRDGRFVVMAFLTLCFLVALGTVLLTVFGRETAPAEPPPPPPEIGHELVPSRDG